MTWFAKLSQRWLRSDARCRSVKAGVAVTRALLLTVFLAYLARWVACHFGLLCDPALQNDDARTALFPFHQYAANPSFAGDPIAREMMAYVSPGIWVLYRLLVPVTGLYAASKWVQALALMLLGAAGVVLGRSRRGGLASGLLLVFLLLSDSYAVGRIAGGHARAFAFPCFALWVAGVVAKRKWARVAAPIVGAVFYPAVTLMILAGEGMCVVLAVRTWSLRQILQRLRALVSVTAVCLVAALPSVLGGDTSRGPIHTLQQAQAEPAFFQDGRLKVLPFGTPAVELGTAFLSRFSRLGEGLATAGQSTAVFSALTTVLVVIIGLGLVQRRPYQWLPEYVWAFLLGAGSLYFAARWLAFRLYSTERYYAYAMRMASALLIVGLCARFNPRWPRTRTVARNLLAAGLMLASWLCLGDGIVRNNGMTIDAHWDADVYQFIRTLPLTSRFASHPMDGDGVPYFAARATIGSFETLQPWFVNSWQRQKARETATLDALYAKDAPAVIEYAKKYRVDYLLLNSERYQADWHDHMASFEPFTSYTRALARADATRVPLLAHVPGSAVVFERKPWTVVSIARLAASVGAPDTANQPSPGR